MKQIPSTHDPTEPRSTPKVAPSDGMNSEAAPEPSRLDPDAPIDANALRHRSVRECCSITET
jgi:hypothetical protein